VFQLWTSARYSFPLPAGHRFPIAKYERLREQVLTEGIVGPDAIREPERATREALLLVHTADYVDRFASGTLDPAELRRLGFPWSPARSRGRRARARRRDESGGRNASRISRPR
jgi:acetoin utilization deacetylase AcuC-like enzyme